MSIPMTYDEWRNVMRNADESNPAALGHTIFQLDDRIAAALIQRGMLLSMLKELWATARPCTPTGMVLISQEAYDAARKAWAAIQREMEATGE